MECVTSSCCPCPSQGGHEAELERVRQQLEEATAEVKRMDASAISQESELAVVILREVRGRDGGRERVYFHNRGW